IGLKDLPTIYVRHRLANIFKDGGFWLEKQVLDEEIFVICKKVFGEHHSDTLDSMANVASTYYALGKVESAEELEKEVLDLRKKTMGEHHPNTLSSMNSLACVYLALGKFENAKKLGEDVLELR
ncbi:hypothetical protein BDP27DRAFT_1158368, partial [Rhodocollybia butyracea]